MSKYNQSRNNSKILLPLVQHHFLDEIDKYTKQLPTTQQTAVWNGILATSEVEIPKYSQPSEYVTSNNNNVIKTAILINCIVCFVVFFANPTVQIYSK